VLSEPARQTDLSRPPDTGRTESDEEVFRQLFDTPNRALRLRFRHWAGIGLLTLTVGATALVVPPLIRAAPPAPPPVEQPEAPVLGPPPFPADTPSSVVTSPSAAFTPLSMQGEDAILLKGAVAVSCARCSGGRRAHFLGTAEMRFTVPVAGRHTIAVDYTAAGVRWLSVTVNSVVVLDERKVTGTSFNTPARLTLESQIPDGEVSIMLFSYHSAPDIDAVTII
jgi:hypothetical protein